MEERIKELERDVSFLRFVVFLQAIAIILIRMELNRL